jgi:hypothetical protein
VGDHDGLFVVVTVGVHQSAGDADHELEQAHLVVPEEAVDSRRLFAGECLPDGQLVTVPVRCRETEGKWLME